MDNCIFGFMAKLHEMEFKKSQVKIKKKGGRIDGHYLADAHLQMAEWIMREESLPPWWGQEVRDIYDYK